MDASVIQALLPPVVIISSCGLLCLGQFARYTAIVGRVRGLHRERLDLLLHLPGDAADTHEHRLMAHRAAHLESQAHRMLGHARLIRRALLLLVLAVISLAACSLLIGVEQLLPAFCHGASVAAFVVGLLCVLVGMVFVFAEVQRSLDLVLDEHARLETIADNTYQQPEPGDG